MSPWLSDIFLSSQSDERLVALARAGHERAFAAIVERYRRELGAYARRLDSSGRAEDIVQQALLSAFTALRSGTEVAHLRGWLYQIVRNTAIRASARERPATELDASLAVTESLEDAVETRIRAREVLTELGRLPKRQRDAIVEMSITGKSRAEVASAMGLSEGAVRQLAHRARIKLRSAITALFPFPFARLLAAGRDGGASDVVMGAGAVSAGGVIVKVGALVATGVVATAVVSSPLGGHHRKAAAPHRVSAVAAPRAIRHGGHPVVIASTGRAVNLSSIRTAEPTAIHRRGGTDRSRTGSSTTGSGDDGSSGGSGPSGPGGALSSGGSSSTEGATDGSPGGPTATASDTGTSVTGSDGGSGGTGSGGGSTSSDGGTGSTTTTSSDGGTGSTTTTSSDGGTGSTTTTSSDGSGSDGGMVSSGSGTSSTGVLTTSDGGGGSGG